MAIVNMEDKGGFTEVVVFPDVFAQCAPLLNMDRPLLITGVVEAGDNLVKVRAQDIVALEIMKQKSINAIVIPLSHKGLNRSKLIKLRDLVFKYPGECRLKFKINLNGEEVTAVAHNRYSIIPEKGLIEQIESLVESKVIQEAEI